MANEQAGRVSTRAVRNPLDAKRWWMAITATMINQPARQTRNSNAPQGLVHVSPQPAVAILYACSWEVRPFNKIDAGPCIRRMHAPAATKVLQFAAPTHQYFAPHKPQPASHVSVLGPIVAEAVEHDEPLCVVMDVEQTWECVWWPELCTSRG